MWPANAREDSAPDHPPDADRDGSPQSDLSRSRLHDEDAPVSPMWNDGSAAICHRAAYPKISPDVDPDMGGMPRVVRAILRANHVDEFLTLTSSASP